MNTSSFDLEPISQDGVLVTVALALIALLAILTVIAMLWGARLKRQRRAAEAEEQHRIEELKADGVEVTNTVEGSSPVMGSAAPSPTPAPEPRPEHSAPDQAAAVSDQPIAAAAPFDASPATVATGTATTEDQGGDGAQSITILKGLGPKIASRLEELGITRLDQLAWLDDAEAEQLDAQLGTFRGRMERDRWREQARLLAKGEHTAYETQFGKLG